MGYREMDIVHARQDNQIERGRERKGMIGGGREKREKSRGRSERESKERERERERKKRNRKVERGVLHRGRCTSLRNAGGQIVFRLQRAI
jgi:hypothetical protein